MFTFAFQWFPDILQIISLKSQGFRQDETFPNHQITNTLHILVVEFLNLYTVLSYMQRHN